MAMNNEFGKYFYAVDDIYGSAAFGFFCVECSYCRK